jgi:hypothetical protein
MSFGDYLGGVLGLAAVAVPMALAAVRLRARFLPGWTGAPARLVETVAAVAILTVLLQLLGAFGILAPAPLLVGAIAVGVAARLWVTPSPGEPMAPPAPPIPWLQALVALGAAAFVAAHWATGLQDVWGRGMLTFDTLWYHGPFAARIADTGSVWGMHFTDPLYLNWFYPENSELVHGAGIALLDRDIFSPLVNFGWLGVAPLTLVAVALAMDTGPLVPREAGTPATDTAPIALLLAAAAILINAWASGRRATPVDSGAGEGAEGNRHGAAPEWPLAGAAIATAGLAMGLALGTRLTIGGAVLAMAVGIPFIVPRALRWRALGLFLAGVAVTAGFWFVRDLIHSGTPLPWVREIGPIHLPGPNRGLEGRDNFTVSHYILSEPDKGVWSSFFLVPIENLLGPVWFLFLGGAAAAGILAIWRPRSSAVRLCGVVTVATGIAYLFTPLTAAGPEGHPLAFGINLRYVIPGFALGLALLPLEPRLTPARLRLPLLGGGLVALFLTSFYSDADVAWDSAFASVPWAVLIGLVLVGAPVGLAILARRGRALAAIAGAALALVVFAAGWERQDDYFAHRYKGGDDDFRFQLDDAIRFAEDHPDSRIGVAGTSGAYSQYGFYGDDLSNYVQYVGRHLPEADFRAITKCAAFREAVNDGNYDYLITTPSLDLNNPGTAHASPEGGWIRGDPAAKLVLDSGRVAIFELDGDLSPAGCGGGAADPKPGNEGTPGPSKKAGQ